MPRDNISIRRRQSENSDASWLQIDSRVQIRINAVSALLLQLRQCLSRNIKKQTVCPGRENRSCCVIKEGRKEEDELVFSSPKSNRGFQHDTYA